MSKMKLNIALGVLAIGATMAPRAQALPLSYSANFCSPMYFSSSQSYYKGSTFTPYGSYWMDIVCPFILQGDSSWINYTQLRYRSASSAAGGSCSAFTVTSTGSTVSYVSKSLTTSTYTYGVASFGTISGFGATQGYMTCYVPPGTSLTSYFTNQLAQ